MITVIGAGRVGVGTAIQLALRGLDDLTLIDIVPGLPQGEALDLNHMCATLGIDVDLRGSNDYRDMSGSQVVVTTAGFIRKADMTRLDLLHKNSEVMKSVCKNIVEYAPNCKLIVVTNPLDVMTFVAYKLTNFGASRVMGFSGPLDISRYKYLLSQELKVSTASIQAMVIGEHGESMVLLPRFTTVAGNSLSSILPKEKIQEIVERTRKTGAEVIKLKTWSASHAPGAGVAEMVDAVVRDRKTVIPTSVYLNGEYGVRDVCVVVPAVLGAGGVEKIIELPLNEEEKALFLKSVETVRSAGAQVSL